MSDSEHYFDGIFTYFASNGFPLVRSTMTRKKELLRSQQSALFFPALVRVTWEGLFNRGNVFASVTIKSLNRWKKGTQIEMALPKFVTGLQTQSDGLSLSVYSSMGGELQQGKGHMVELY